MVMRRRRQAAEAASAQPAMSGSAQEMGAGGSGTRYRMAERLAAIGDDFFIQTDGGQRAFKVDGKAIRLRDTLKFEDMRGTELCEIQGRVARVRETIEVTGPKGQNLATVRKKMITPVRERFTIDLAGGPTLEVQGNIVSHEFHIDGPSGRVAEVSKRWFRVRDSYGVEIAPGQNDVLILAAVVGIDQMISDAG
jgi:uncharacterized protein YxjI